MAVRLLDISMRRESLSYIDALHAILVHKGWFSYPKFMLAGMTTAAFRFTLHRGLSEDSPTTYNWMAENFQAADFIGAAVSQSAGFSFDATFPLYREAAIDQIKSSIDLGTGAVLWKDGFVVAAGYDDTKAALLLRGDGGDGQTLLPYEEFGCNTTPYWYYQVIEGFTELDHMEICRESLLQAVARWESHDPMLPQGEYACGRDAYPALLTALRQGGFDWLQTQSVLRSYAVAKRDVMQYAAVLQSYWPELEQAAHHYAQASAAFSEGQQQVCTTEQPLGAEEMQHIIQSFAAAQREEELAILCIRQVMRESIVLRRGDMGLR